MLLLTRKVSQSSKLLQVRLLCTTNEKVRCELHAVNCASVQGLQRTQLRADYLLAKRLAEELPPVSDEDDEDQRADADGDDLDEPDGDEPDGDEPDDDEPDDDEGPRVVGVDDGSYAW